ncbi:uncharacterized protein ARMOST_07556 [Armillaria ostoyae]|uniref:F-box domain-containing protein n=1 Tax=Armillaria ostoyae TaxID=47428 RepID=A0A284R649_ARMOS|nr:uncharacterized protein ARMOST_07556 [Armillaria ostoyae]
MSTHIGIAELLPLRYLTESELLESGVLPIQESLSSAQHDLEDIDEHLKVLQQKRRTAQSIFLIHHSLCSPCPIRRLPLELLQKVFRLMVKDYFWLGDIRASPWSISHVCTKWQSVVLSNGRMWAEFSIINASYAIPSHHLVSLVLERANRLPLTFSLTTSKFNKGLSETDASNARQVMMKLAEESISWRFVSLSLDFICLLDNPFAMLHNRLSSLEALSVSAGSGPGDISLLGRLFTDCLQLRHVALEDPEVELDIPWNQLTIFTSFHSDSSYILQTIALSKNLRTLELPYINHAPINIHASGMDPLDVIELPFLESLLLGGAALLSHLSLPALTVLRLRNRGEDRLVDSLNIAPFLDRSQCLLYTLGISHLDTKHLPDIFSHCRGLEHVVLSKTTNSPHSYLQDVLSLCRGPEEDSLLPRLMMLMISLQILDEDGMGFYGPPPSAIPLLEMVESRDYFGTVKIDIIQGTEHYGSLVPDESCIQRAQALRESGRSAEYCVDVDGKLGLADAMSLLRDGHQFHKLGMPGGLLKDTEQLHHLQLDVLVHHALQVLQIHEPAILKNFRVPSLIWDPYTNEFATIATFLSHSPALQIITMTVDWFDLGHITDDLTSQMPQLQCLRLKVRCDNGPEDASCIFVELMLDMLPTLVELAIDGNITLRAEELAAMLNHRSMIGPGLQHVSLRCADFLASDIECEVLQQMIEDGLELDINGK